jgi:hypothetical protein
LLLMFRYELADRLFSRYPATLTVGFPASSYWLLRSARGSQDHSAIAPLPAFTCSGSLCKMCLLTFPVQRLDLLDNLAQSITPLLREVKPKA